MFENIDTSLIDWSRAQFALTAMYHWLFVPLTLGLAVIMGLMETFYVTTGKEFWKNTAKFWMKLFGINFAVGEQAFPSGIHLAHRTGSNDLRLVDSGRQCLDAIPRRDGFQSRNSKK